MMKVVISLIVIAFPLFARSQQHVNLKAEDTLIYTTVEHEPEFPGGIEKLLKYLMRNTHYNEKDMQKEGFQGSFVFQMIIEKDGSISNVKELRRTPNTSIGKEMVRIIKASPKWKPGIQNHHPVRVRYLIPIHF